LKVSILGTVARDTILFRRELILKLVDEGHEVFVFCIDYTDETRQLMHDLGCTTIDYSLSRAGLNPFADLAAIYILRKTFFKNKAGLSFVLFCQTFYLWFYCGSDGWCAKAFCHA